MTARVAGGAALAAIFLVMLPDPRPLDVPVALAVAALALLLIGGSPLRRAGGPRPRLARRLAAAPGVLAWVAGDVATGTARVALAVAGARPPRSPGRVTIEVGPCSEQTLVVTGVLLTLSPGSILIGADPERRVLEVHLIDADDPRRTTERITRLHARVRTLVGG
jgi:multisubunit Na+/H+ antiporter MnhE subunit